MRKNYLQKLNTYSFLNHWTLSCSLETTWCYLTEYKRLQYWLDDIVTIDNISKNLDIKKGQIYKTNWKGPLPYRLKLDVEITNVMKCSMLSIKTLGDLKGFGVIKLTPIENSTKITFSWHAQPTVLWMRLLAPFAKWFFIHNHNKIIDKGYDNFQHYLIHKQ